MRHACAVMHVGIANQRWRGNLPGIPGACATRNFRYLIRGPYCNFTLFTLCRALFILFNSLTNRQNCQNFQHCHLSFLERKTFQPPRQMYQCLGMWEAKFHLWQDLHLYISDGYLVDLYSHVVAEDNFSFSCSWQESNHVGKPLLCNIAYPSETYIELKSRDISLVHYISLSCSTCIC